MRIYRQLIVMVFTFGFSVASQAEILFRFSGALGSPETEYSFVGQKKSGEQINFKLLQYIHAGPFVHAWGLELGKLKVLDTDTGELNYRSIGLMVEARPLKKLIVNMGTSGYRGSGISISNPYGLHNSIGTDFSVNHFIRLSAFIRRDQIFDQKKTTINSFEVGLEFYIK